MHVKGANADVVGDLYDANQGVSEQLTAKPVPLLADVDCEPRDEQGRDRVSRHPSSHLRDRVLVLDHARTESVANDSTARGRDVHAGHAGPVARQRMLPKPRVEHLDSAVERGDYVVRADPARTLVATQSNRSGSENSATSSGRISAGASRAFW